MHNSLENLTHALNIFFFPTSFKNRKNFRLLNSSHVMLRTEALTRFSSPPAGSNRTGMLVTYPEALFEKVVLPKTLAGNIIYLKSGDTIDVEGLLQQLVGYGFSSTDFVYEPGQFALRGGILDIYSFGNEKPYRVELFGNDVDSIRIFDPETQLSERKLLQVSIIPNVETQFDDDDKISLFDFLPENTVYWLQDRELALEKLRVQEEDLQQFIKMREEGLVKSGPMEIKGKRAGVRDTSYAVQEEDDKEAKSVIVPEDFISASDMERQLRNFH